MSNRTVPMFPVTSSKLEAIGYHTELKVLLVKFKTTGKTLAYLGVPPQAHADLMAAAADEAQSVGSHFAKHIRPHYAYTAPESVEGLYPSTTKES